MANETTPTRTRPHVHPIVSGGRRAPAGRLAHHRDIQEEWLRELTATASPRIRTRSIVLRRSGASAT